MNFLNKFKNLFQNQNIVVLLLIVVIFVELIFYFQVKISNTSNLENHADKVIALCAKANHRPTCYDEAIPQLMNSISMEDAFKVTYLVQNKDRSYVYCHVLAHKLSAAEVIKNPSLWKDVVTRVPSGQCSNGGIHGAFQEKFRGEFFSAAEIEVLKPELDDLCEQRENWTPTGMEQASCYHALGHLTMYITSANIRASIKLCDDLALKKNGRNFKHLCYDGVFMQLFQPLEPEDFSLIKDKEINKEQHISFCNKFTGEVKGSCWSEGWPLYRDELEKPEGLVNFCSKAPLLERDRCFMAIIYVMTAIFQLDSEKVLAYCPSLPKEKQGMCFSSAAGRMIEVDYRNIEQAVRLCEESLKYDQENSCFKMLLQYSGYNYKVGSPEFYHVCKTLPKEWGRQCLKKEKK